MFKVRYLQFEEGKLIRVKKMAVKDAIKRYGFKRVLKSYIFDWVL